MREPIVSIITPTTGKESLSSLVGSCAMQDVPCEHILLWDDKRDTGVDPHTVAMNHEKHWRGEKRKDITIYSIVVPGKMVQSIASGSALRAVGLMAARGKFVTFADDDVWWRENHLESMLTALSGNMWAFCKRRIYDNEGKCLGIDEFESVGDSPNRKVPYEMVDNNSMIFNRKFGVSGACLYRETVEYNDDRLMYAFLKKHAGSPGRTNEATVNQMCPERLETMFRMHCTKE